MNYLIVQQFMFAFQENAHNTFHVYFLLMQALLVTVSGVKTYEVQYNEESAW